MASVTSFIRNTPASSLQAYFSQVGILGSVSIDWSAAEPEVVRGALKAVDEMDEQARARVINDAERVGALADDAGQTALYSVIDDRALLDVLANGHARSLWLFLNHPVLFRHAEEVRFTDEKRRGRSWDGFIIEAGGTVRRDPISIEAFKASLRTRFASANVHVDIFERVRPTFEGEDCDLVQITVYREGLPDDQLAFDDGGILIRRAYRPVFEAAMTYEPASGVIEVVASDRESRAEMALFLARDLLGVDFQNEKVPVRRYDLDVLLSPFDFPTDLDDGIERVDVRLLRLMPLDAVGERVTLECMAKAGRTIWSMAEERLGPGNPIDGGWVATQAKLTIKFHPKGDARRGRTLPLTITMPHGCNLKDQTEEEQLIGEKYLRRWGILADDAIASKL
ncbi:MULTISPECIES: hypothetical protein [Hyphomicrobiales]|jgi:hypothetical protein|uniref:Uncharacterized protein n=2 Tax=Hyphomicrobiales TaxID=356 RepID=A0ABW0F7T9_9HYPH|nr:MULTISPECIES: hypothetical protein [Hyphomicrobiales]MCT4494528.1 hypothetical protein [Bosea minatitlanensis]TSJ64155.1 hypothetical protein FO470_02360 [Ancylobacter moscoviensis]